MPRTTDPSAVDMEATYAATRVVKRLSASQRGALKLARRYGAALVCVRYRHDAQGQQRYTTVELVVDEAPIEKRVNLAQFVSVRIGLGEVEKREQAIALGATWNPHRKLWRMTLRVAKRLRLEDGIQAGQTARVRGKFGIED